MLNNGSLSGEMDAITFEDFTRAPRDVKVRVITGWHLLDRSWVPERAPWVYLEAIDIWVPVIRKERLTRCKHLRAPGGRLVGDRLVFQLPRGELRIIALMEPPADVSK